MPGREKKRADDGRRTGRQDANRITLAGRVGHGSRPGMGPIWIVASGTCAAGNTATLSRIQQDPHSLRGHTTRSPAWRSAPMANASSRGSWDNTVKVWDADKGTEILTLKGHTGVVTAWRSAPMANASSAAARTRR